MFREGRGEGTFELRLGLCLAFGGRFSLFRVEALSQTQAPRSYLEA